jgi:5-methylcytosine-specific restriction endonuclease McrA
MPTPFLAKYRDPRWQRLRLEVMQEANFMCDECHSETETLNVHHRFYRKGADPWEYDLDELVCLCEKCHQYIHQQKNRLNAALANPNNSYLIDYFVGYAEASNCDGEDNWEPFVKVAYKPGKIHISSSSMAHGVADGFCIQYDDVADICFDDYVSVKTLCELRRATWKKSK